MSGQDFNSGNYQQPHADFSQYQSDEQLAAELGLVWYSEDGTANRPIPGPIATNQHRSAVVSQWTVPPGDDVPSVPAIGSGGAVYQTTTNLTSFGHEMQDGTVAGGEPSPLTDLDYNFEYAIQPSQAGFGYADSTYGSSGVCTPGAGNLGGWAGPTQSGYGGDPATGYSGNAARTIQMPAAPLSNVAIHGPSVNYGQGGVCTGEDGPRGWHGSQTPAASSHFAYGQIEPQSSPQAGTIDSDHGRSRHHEENAKRSRGGGRRKPYERRDHSHRKSGNAHSTELNAARDPAVRDSMTVHGAPTADAYYNRAPVAMPGTDMIVDRLGPNYSYNMASPAGGAPAFDANSSAYAPEYGTFAAPMSGVSRYDGASAPTQVSEVQPRTAKPPTVFGSADQQRKMSWLERAYCSLPGSQDEAEALRGRTQDERQKGSLIKMAKVAIRESKRYFEGGYGDWTTYVQSGNPRSTTSLGLLVDKLRSHLGKLQRTDATIYDFLSLGLRLDEKSEMVALEAWRPAVIDWVDSGKGKHTKKVAKPRDGAGLECVAHAQDNVTRLFPEATSRQSTQLYAGDYLNEYSSGL